MAMNTITAATTLAAATAFTLSGPCRLKADDLAAGDFVYFFQERLDGDFDPVPASSVPGAKGGGQFFFDKNFNSCLFEGYGDYKAVVSRADIDLGYAS